MPRPSRENGSHGYLAPIGGAESSGGERSVLQRFVELAGGAQARIAVIPTASEQEHAGEHHAARFSDLGVDRVDVLPITERSHANLPESVTTVEGASGIFLTGGNQLRLSTILGGTALARAIRARHAHGVPVAGTSAGAAVLAEHMIAGGDPGATPTADGVIMAPGLGLTNSMVIDQHFLQRCRLGRLLSAVAFTPFAVGIGLDEDTGLFLGPDGVFEVVGSGSVTIVDPADLEYSSMDSARPGQPVTLIGVKIHVLGAGGRFDTNTRIPVAPARPPPLPRRRASDTD